jgi:hypothetical protein
VTADGTIQRALYKREVMLSAVRQLVARGHHPDEIERTAGRKIFEAIDGEVHAVEFREELTRRRPNDPQAAKRYYAMDDQLFTANGRTYALTTQWTKAAMEAVLASFAVAYGDYGFSYSVSQQSRRSSQ